MARRARGGAPEVSLFPFLSILACVIGTLTLMITALALGQISGGSAKDLAELELAKNHTAKQRELTQQIESKEEARLEQLQAELRRAEQQSGETQTAIAQRRAELDRVLADLENVKNTKPDAVPIPTVDAKTLEAHLAKLEEQLKMLQEQIAALETELKGRKMPPEEAVVQVRPGGSGLDLQPTFVECAASSVVVYGDAEPRRILRQNIVADKEFLALLDGIAESPKKSVIFLVRDDGLSTYYSARNVARSRYARNGKLPVLGQGKIDLTMFKK